MRILPVIDLLHGQVVRGIAGQRERYAPVVSRLSPSSAPGAVAQALATQLSLDEVYVADLDAIAGREPAWKIYDEIAAAGLALWIDAGLASVARARSLAEFRPAGAEPAGIIAGLESLADPQLLAEICRAVGPGRVVFSLDLKNGRPLTSSAAWQALTPAAMVDAAVELGIGRVIVLDLARVGVGEGTGTEALCRQLHHRHPRLELIGGGGIRSPHDLKSLAEAGLAGALVASALHDGRIGREDLAAAKHWLRA